MSNFADQISLPVQYRGENTNKQHCFSNGSPLVTDVFPTLEAGVEKYGDRIETGDKTMQFSGPWNTGVLTAMSGKPYAPPFPDVQNRTEYGLGYLKGLLARRPPPPAPPPPEPYPIIPTPDRKEPEIGAIRKRGRPRKKRVVRAEEEL